jgi:hypothetical protein
VVVVELKSNAKNAHQKDLYRLGYRFLVVNAEDTIIGVFKERVPADLWRKALSI